MSKSIVIGSGVAGLATAIRLRAMGHSVHVFESNSYPGGKLSELRLGKFRFDAGPSLFTMPQLVDELFELMGENPREHFDYNKLEVSCHYFYEDGTSFICPSDKDGLAQTLEKHNGESKEKVLSHLKWSEKIFNITSPVFLENSLHKFTTYGSKSGLKGIANLWRIGLLGTMNGKNSGTFKHPRTIQFFNRFATYNGSNPFVAPATLNLIPHLEFNLGTYFPHKGMVGITNALYELALRHGVEFQFDTPVESIIIEDEKIKGVRTRLGSFYSDIVVSNMDVFATYDKLIKTMPMPGRIKKQESSSSAIVFYWGMNRSFEQLGLHNIFFSSDYKDEFNHIFKSKTLSDDPTVYVHVSCKEKKDDAPEGCENWFVMVNAPSMESQNWDELVERARKNIIDKLSKSMGLDISSYIETEDYLDPRRISFRTQSYKGALYGGSSNSRLSAFFRHPNFTSNVKGLYFCGGSVHPGGGIPLCLRSSQIVSRLIERDSSF